MGGAPDYFNLPRGPTSDVQIYGPADIPQNEINAQIWRKPRGRSFLFVTLIGAAAGGGGGQGSTAGSARGGGGGGASGGIAHGLFPFAMLPDALWILCASGGLGGAGGSSGGGSTGGLGYPTYLMASCMNVNDDVVPVGITLLKSEGGGGGGGVGGSAGSGGSGGTAGSAASQTNAQLSSAGLAYFLQGKDGQVGGSGAAPAALTLQNQLLQPGCGGTGCTAADLAGAGYAAVADTLFFAVPGGAAGSTPGGSGFRRDDLPFWYGGTGGGSSNSTTGGAGGYGAVPGCGGAGGSAGVTVGGRGGDGGPGCAILTCW